MEIYKVVLMGGGGGGGGGGGSKLVTILKSLKGKIHVIPWHKQEGMVT